MDKVGHQRSATQAHARALLIPTRIKMTAATEAAATLETVNRSRPRTTCVRCALLAPATAPPPMFA